MNVKRDQYSTPEVTFDSDRISEEGGVNKHGPENGPHGAVPLRGLGSYVKLAVIGSRRVELCWRSCLSHDATCPLG